MIDLSLIHILIIVFLSLFFFNPFFSSKQTGPKCKQGWCIFNTETTATNKQDKASNKTIADQVDAQANTSPATKKADTNINNRQPRLVDVEV